MFIYEVIDAIESEKLKYGMGVALFEDETVYLKEVAKKAHVEFSILETKKSFENLVGKDINANNGLGSNYELRVYRPNYPTDKKISRWIEIESSNTRFE